MGVLDKLTSFFSTTRKNSKYAIPESPGQLAPISNNQQKELNAIHAMAEKINKKPANNTYKNLYQRLQNPNVLASTIGKNWMKNREVLSEVTPPSKVPPPPPNKPRSVTIGGKRHKEQKKHRKTFKRKQ